MYYDRSLMMKRLVDLDLDSEFHYVSCSGGLFVDLHRYSEGERFIIIFDGNRGIYHQKRVKNKHVVEYLAWAGVCFDNLEWWAELREWKDPDRVLSEPNIIQPKEKFVYFIFDEEKNKVKIGKSQTPDARLGDLQRGSTSILRLLGYIPGGHSKESELHKQFDHLRAHGEWFNMGDDLREYIDSVLVNNENSSNIVGQT